MKLSTRRSYICRRAFSLSTSSLKLFNLRLWHVHDATREIHESLRGGRPGLGWFLRFLHGLRFPLRCRLRRCRDEIGAGQVAVGQAASDDVTYHLKESLPVASAPLVETEGFFIEVAEKVEGLHADIGALERSLQETPEVLQAVSVDVPLHVALGVIDDVVNVLGIEPVIGLQLVSEDCAPRLDVLPDLFVKSALPDVVHDFHAYGAMPAIPVTLEESHHGGLTAPAGAGDGAPTPIIVHEAGTSADVGLIRFDLTGHLPEGSRLHGEPNPMEHEPRGFLSDVQVSRKLIRTDSILTVGNQPEGWEPLVQANRAVFHHGAHLDRELTPRVAFLAGPDAAAFHERHPVTMAGRTRNLTVRPAETDHEGVCGFESSEGLDGFEEGLWAVHDSNIGPIAL